MKGYEDVCAGLMILVVVLLGGYFFLKSEVYEQKNLEKQAKEESKTHKMTSPVVDWSKFEVAHKRTE